MHLASTIGFAALWLAALLPGQAFAEGGGSRVELRVGVMEAPPFVVEGDDRRWEGVAIDLWESVARELKAEYGLHRYDSIEELLEAVRTGELDVSPLAAASPAREVALDLSHSYYQSGLAIAVTAAGADPGWLGVVPRVFSFAFLRVIGLLLVLWLAAGTVVWGFERSRNREMFGGGALEGLGDGIWWAAVTMTTVGYGDKAPRTIGGRLTAIVWMLTSIVLISSFTASITTSLTIGELHGRIRGLRDLRAVRVGSVSGSVALDFLGEQGIPVRSYLHELDGLKALADGELDAFVYDELVLRHLIGTKFPARLRVLPTTFDRYQVTMAVPSGSTLREPLNQALLKVLDEEDWRRRLERFADPNR